MTKLRFLFMNFKLNVFQNAFMILEICLFFIFINVTVSDLIYNNNVNNYISNYDSNKIFLSGATSLNVDFGDQTAFYNLVDNIENIEGVESVGYQIEESVKINNQLVLCMYLNEGMSDIEYPLIPGNWFNDRNCSDGIILGGNIANKYKVGQSIEVEHVTYEGNELVYKPTKATVIGKLKSPAYIINLNYTSTKPNSINLLEPYNDIILTQSNKLLSDQEIHYPLGSLMVNLKHEKISNEISNFGQPHTLDNIQKSSKEQLKKTLKDRLPATFTLLIAILFGLIGTIYLFVYKTMRVMSIYNLCGLQKNTIRKIIFQLNFCCILLGCLSSVITLSVPSIKNFLLGYAQLGLLNAIITIGVITITSLISFLFSSMLTQQNAISSLRRFE